jgi:hypothetical protein
LARKAEQKEKRREKHAQMSSKTVGSRGCAAAKQKRKKERKGRTQLTVCLFVSKSPTLDRAVLTTAYMSASMKK